MKKNLYVFKSYLIQISHDFMLLCCIFAPILIGCVFHYGLPLLEKVLCSSLNTGEIISPYYGIFDLILAIMTPIMFCFAGVLVILEELDSGVTKYYEVTPIGKSGYIFSRIVFPAIMAFVYDIILLSIFSISEMKILMIFLMSVCSMFITIITALFVISFAKNKIEGMALIKSCGLFIVGIPVAYFIHDWVKYCFGILPTFWMAEFYINNDLISFVLSIVLSIILIYLLYGKFRRKLL